LLDNEFPTRIVSFATISREYKMLGGMKREYSRVRSQRPIRSVLLEAWCETYWKFVSIRTFAREVAPFSYHSEAEQVVILQQIFGVEHSSGKIGEVHTGERVHSAGVASNAIEVEMLKHHLQIIRAQIRN